MQTSNFTTHGRQHFDAGVSIAAGQPKWVKVSYQYGRLAPTYNLLRKMRAGKITTDEYAIEYNAQLAKLDPQAVWDELHTMTLGVEPTLMCHCKTTDFCHRQLAADWLERKLNIKIPEYGSSGVIRFNGWLKLPEQKSLF